jgi:DNA-binding transcriptional LysR family regulator
MDSIDAARVFLEVAERQSFTGAAARLGLSKALVSKHVAALEARAGARLLNRSTRKVWLTEAGAAFAERARAAIAAFDAMMEAATEDAATPAGLLRLAAPKVYGETVLAPLLAEFLATQPRLRLEAAFEERLVDVIGEGFDVAIRLGDPPDSALAGVRLGRFPYVLCAARAHVAARGAPRTPQELPDHDAVVNVALAPNGQWTFTGPSGVERVAPRVRVRVNGDAPAAAFVRAGLGVGLLMRAPVEAELADGRLVELLADRAAYDRAVWALTPHRTLQPAKTRRLLDFLRARLGG